MIDDWRAEAIGLDVEPWVGMVGFDRFGFRCLMVGPVDDGANAGEWLSIQIPRDGPNADPGDAPVGISGGPYMPDLDHRPTRLEFMARLALRLGAPAEVEP